MFVPEEQVLIDSVCDELGRMSATALSTLSHKVPAWHYAFFLAKLSPELIAYGRKEGPEGL